MRKGIPIPVRVEAPLRPSFEDRLRELGRPLQALDEAAASRHFELPTGATLLKTTLSLCPDCLAHVRPPCTSMAARYSSARAATPTVSAARCSRTMPATTGCRTRTNGDGATRHGMSCRRRLSPATAAAD